MTATDTHIDAHEHDHPSDKNYVLIAIILAFFTIVEVLMFVFEEDLPRNGVKIGLIVLMSIKFWIVGAYFMHLKFDASILTQLFVAGLILAIAVYFIMLSSFEFSFWNDGLEDTGLPGGKS